MNPSALVLDLGLVTAQALLLYLISRRLLLGHVLGRIAARSPGRLGRLVVTFLRLPGNLLHEVSHAAGYLVSGYTIRRLATCATDPEGRGYCEPGPPWSPVRWLSLAAAFAAVLPLFVGALAVRELGDVLGVRLPAAHITGESVPSVVAHLVLGLPGFLAGLRWAAWQTWLFWYLAFSIGAELAPSEVDLRRGGPIVVLGLGLLVLLVYALPHMELRAEDVAAIGEGLQRLLRTLSSALAAGLVGCGLIGAALGLPAALLRR